MAADQTRSWASRQREIEREVSAALLAKTPTHPCCGMRASGRHSIDCTKERAK